MVELLLDVLLEIRREGLGQRVGVADSSRERVSAASVSGTVARMICVLLDQVLRPQLGEPRVLDERLVRRCEGTDGERRSSA